MMKHIALIMPPDLMEDGRLLPARAHMLRLLAQHWRERYRLTVILRAVRDKAYDGIPEGVELLLDDAAADMAAQPHATYMQRGLAAWQTAAPLFGSWDCVIALDGLHPWCLATALYRVRAARRLVYIPCDPHLYLQDVDAAAFGVVYAALDGVMTASHWTQEGFEGMFPQVGCAMMHPPCEALTAEPIDCPEADCLHILTVEPLTAWHQAERIPALAAAVKGMYPALRWHIFGEGPRQPYLLREVILNDVCGEVFPEGVSNRMSDLLPYCSGMVHFDDENEGAAVSAQALGIPVLSLRRDEGEERLAAWLDGLRPQGEPRQPVWSDGALWTKMIEGE